MTTEIDAILRRVAAGELTPEEALPLVDAAQRAEGSGTVPEWGTPLGTKDATGGPETETTSPGREGPVRGVRIAISYRSVDVVADPTVDSVSVNGPHSVRRDGDVLVIESTQFQGFTEFDGGRGEPGGSGGAWSFMPRSAAWARGIRGGHVTVRVNPTLPVTLDSAGAAVRLSGCEGGARVRLVAASLKLERVRGPLEIDALTSSVKGTAAITGDSRISGESASVKLTLLAGSDVRMSVGANRMGKIILPGRPHPGAAHRSESVVGSGAGTLVVDGVMSSITISAEQGLLQESA